MISVTLENGPSAAVRSIFPIQGLALLGVPIPVGEVTVDRQGETQMIPILSWS